MTGGICDTPSHSTYIFSADITPEMLNFCRVTEVKVFFLVLVCVFNFNSVFEFSVAILKKGLFRRSPRPPDITREGGKGSGTIRWDFTKHDGKAKNRC